jgi:hypothetical protein
MKYNKKKISRYKDSCGRASYAINGNSSVDVILIGFMEI